jgi:hypothetical protein
VTISEICSNSYRSISALASRYREVIDNNENLISNFYIDLDKLSKNYNHELSIKYGDVVDLHILSYSVYKLINLMKDIKNKTLKGTFFLLNGIKLSLRRFGYKI